MISEVLLNTPTTTMTTGIRKNKNDQIRMLTYGCGNVTQDNAAVVGGGKSRFGQPALEKNGAQPPNTNNDGANASGKVLLGRVVNAATNRIGGPEFI